MRTITITGVLLLMISAVACAEDSVVPACTLSITVHGVNSSKGVVGVVVFRSPTGWPESVATSFRHLAFPAQKGEQKISIPDLPPGRYAVALIHDVNANMKLDKNWLGKPTEQWGMANNPRSSFKAPPFERAVIELAADKSIEIQLQ